jgi:hypothetical protein
MVEIVGNGTSRIGSNPPQADTHYSSLKGLDSLEREKLDSSEEARFAARGLSRMQFSVNAGADLAMLERALDAGEVFDRLEAYKQLGNLFTADQPASVRQWALRLADKLVEAMTPDELTRWRQTYACGEAA